MENSKERRGLKGDPSYEQLLFECQKQSAELERQVKELELRIQKLKKENAGLKAQVQDLEKVVKAGEHDLRRLGPMGKPLVW